MKCPKCEAENNESAKFYKNCGETLKTEEKVEVKKKSSITENRNLIIIAALAIICIVLATTVMFGGSLLKGDVPLENHDFGGIEMLIPVGSDFVETNEIPAFGSVGGLVQYANQGKYSDEAYSIMFSTIDGGSAPSSTTFDRKEGDVVIYKDKNGENAFYMTREVDDVEIHLVGGDEKTMIKMLNSVKVSSDFTDEKTTQESTTTQPAQTTAPATTAMTILGGSFSTGGGLEDKTYADIYVGPEHAGENVIIQIFYSRDGGSLNDGNMVPKTVDSSGYIQVASAEPYSKFPDHAEINLYDSSSNLLDTMSVDLSPSEGTQSF